MIDNLLTAVRDARRLAVPLLATGFLAGLMVGCVVF